MTVPARSDTVIAVKEKMEKWTRRRGQNGSQRGEGKSGRLVGAAKISNELAEWRRLQQKNLSTLGLLKRKEWPQCQKAVGKNARAAFAKRKRNRAVCPKHQIIRWEGVKVSERYTLARERAIKTGAWREKDGFHSQERQVPKK